MSRSNKLAISLFIALILLPVKLSFAQGVNDSSAIFIEDTIIIDLPGYAEDTLFLIFHIPDPATDPLDTLHMLEAGYRRAGIGWTVTLSQGYWEGASSAYNPDYEGPTVIYTVDPLYQMDANQDGLINVGDVVKTLRYIFPRDGK